MVLILTRTAWCVLQVIDIKVSKTGKHGHAKCRFTAIDIFDGSKHEDIVPSTHGAMIPVVTRMEYQVIGLEDGYLQLMTDDGDMKEDLQPPTYPEGLGADLEAAIEAAEAEGLTVVVSVRITGRILHHPAPQFIEIWVAHRLLERWRRRPWCRSRSKHKKKKRALCASLTRKVSLLQGRSLKRQSMLVPLRIHTALTKDFRALGLTPLWH